MDYRLRAPEEVLALEEEALAPYACFARAAGGTRRYPEPGLDGGDPPPGPQGPDPRTGSHGPDPRTAFQHERDRVLHSVAFRRLQYKTQVYVFHEGDFYRTRLTHSIEAAQIGRGLAQRLRVNEDLVEAVCLAHDVGHPPFGHAGESTLKELMADHGGSNTTGRPCGWWTNSRPAIPGSRG